MARPARSRKICSIPRYRTFEASENTEDVDVEKAGAVTLTFDEYEAIRLIDYLGRTHEQCALHMGISRTTVTEIYERARYKLSDMIVNGKGLIIDGGSISVCGTGIQGACSGACSMACTSDRN